MIRTISVGSVYYYTAPFAACQACIACPHPIRKRQGRASRAPSANHICLRCQASPLSLRCSVGERPSPMTLMGGLGAMPPTAAYPSAGVGRRCRGFQRGTGALAPRDKVPLWRGSPWGRSRKSRGEPYLPPLPNVSAFFPLFNYRAPFAHNTNGRVWGLCPQPAHARQRVSGSVAGDSKGGPGL